MSALGSCCKLLMKENCAGALLKSGMYLARAFHPKGLFWELAMRALLDKIVHLCTL